jgi:hypothetical protein
MKKVLLASIALVTLGLTSCKKEYTCMCTTVDNDPNFGGTSSFTYTFTAKKKDAERVCSTYESESTWGGYTSKTTCALD